MPDYNTTRQFALTIPVSVTTGADCTLDVSGGDIRVRVTGIAATNITWATNSVVQPVQ